MKRKSRETSKGSLFGSLTIAAEFVILTLRDPPRPGPAHPREHGDSARVTAHKCPSNKGWV